VATVSSAADGDQHGRGSKRPENSSPSRSSPRDPADARRAGANEQQATFWVAV